MSSSSRTWPIRGGRRCQGCRHPRGEVHVLVLLVPADVNDAALTLGKPLAGPEQFESQRRQLREAAPWIAAPYFARNLGNSLNVMNFRKQRMPFACGRDDEERHCSKPVPVFHSAPSSQGLE